VNVVVLAEEFGGEGLSPAGLWLDELARSWEARGHQMLIVCSRPHPQGDSSQITFRRGIKLWHPGPDRFEEALGEALAEPIDVVHVMGDGPYGARVLEAFRELPVLLDVHDFWPICPNNDLLRRPRLEPCGEHFPYSGCGECAGLPRLRAMDERSELVATARAILVHSTVNRVRLSAGLDRPVELLGYGVDVTRFRPEDPPAPKAADVAQLFETRGRPRVLFLGPPTVARGASRLIDILVALQTRLPDAELVVAGRDPQNPDWGHVFQLEMRELGLADHVTLLPSVSPDDLPALYGSCLVAIAPGTGHPPGGLFMLQALASGLPVIAHPSAGVYEWIHQGVEGILVEANDVPAFAAAVATMLIDPHARKSFGESGRLAALESHDFTRTVAMLEEIYRSCGASGRFAAA